MAVKFRDNTTFPFLKIARERQLDYGFVLAMVMAYEAELRLSGQLAPAQTDDLLAIQAAVTKERSRRAIEGR